jgi:hypothetical protein
MDVHLLLWGFLSPWGTVLVSFCTPPGFRL